MLSPRRKVPPKTGQKAPFCGREATSSLVVAAVRTQDDHGKDVMELSGYGTEQAKARLGLGWQAGRSWNHFETSRTTSIAIHRMHYGSSRGFCVKLFRIIVGSHSLLQEVWPCLFIMVHAWNKTVVAANIHLSFVHLESDIVNVLC